MSTYLPHIKNQKDKSFIKIMDCAFAITEIQNKCNSLRHNIDCISWQISSLKLELISASVESKSAIISQIKNLAEQQKSIKIEVDNMLILTDGPDGYRAKITRLGCDQFFNVAGTNGKGFVNWVLTEGINTHSLINDFTDKINGYLEYPYVSDFAKGIRQKAIENVQPHKFV